MRREICLLVIALVIAAISPRVISSRQSPLSTAPESGKPHSATRYSDKDADVSRLNIRGIRVGMPMDDIVGLAGQPLDTRPHDGRKTVLLDYHDLRVILNDAGVAKRVLGKSLSDGENVILRDPTPEQVIKVFGRPDGGTNSPDAFETLWRFRRRRLEIGFTRYSDIGIDSPPKIHDNHVQGCIYIDDGIPEKEVLREFTGLPDIYGSLK